MANCSRTRGFDVENSLKMRACLLAVAFSLVTSAAVAADRDYVAGYAASLREDYATAARLYRNAAMRGDALAEQALGAVYANGQGDLAHDDAQAVFWYRKAADQGFPTAQDALARAYENGIGVVKDTVKARGLYLAAADQADQNAVRALCRDYPQEPATKRDYVEEYQWCDLAQSVAAITTTEGFDPFVDEDKKQAAAKLTPADIADAEKRVAAWKAEPHFGNSPATRAVISAAGRNEAKAQAELGILYYRAWYVAFDTAVGLFRKAADRGNALAQNYLGMCYRNGQGVSLDNAKALALIRASAAQGNADAENALADEYEEGEIVAADKVQALSYYRMAAAGGNASAQFELGSIYAKGNGVAEDHALAAYWYRRAAEQGNWSALGAMAAAARDGDGVPQDIVAAYAWLDIQAFFTDPHDPDPGDARSRLAAHMTPSQIAFARKRSSTWLAGFEASKA